MLRHAGATSVVVTLTFQPTLVSLRVCDNGRGFDPATLERGGRQLGLTSMAERAAELGGEFLMDSRVGQGTTLTVAINL